jgi:hypothetical protein
MADTETAEDTAAVAQMIGDELELDADAKMLQIVTQAIEQNIKAITPKIRVHNDSNNNQA